MFCVTNSFPYLLQGNTWTPHVLAPSPFVLESGMSLFTISF